MKITKVKSSGIKLYTFLDWVTVQKNEKVKTQIYLGFCNPFNSIFAKPFFHKIPARGFHLLGFRFTWCKKHKNTLSFTEKW
jgi:hypothetical protein